MAVTFVKSGIRLEFLEPDEATAIWNDIAPLFSRVVERIDSGEFTLDDLYLMAASGEIVIGVARKNGEVTIVLAFQPVQYPQAKSVNVLAIAGKNLDQFIEAFLPPFQEFCRDEYDADWIECVASGGAVRMYTRRGFRAVYQHLRIGTGKNYGRIDSE
jgi:hypothetical protein